MSDKKFDLGRPQKIFVERQSSSEESSEESSRYVGQSFQMEESKANNFLLMDAKSDFQKKIEENERELSMMRENLMREKAISELGNYERIVTGKQLKKDYNEGRNPTFKYSELLRTNLQNSYLEKDQRQLPTHYKLVFESFRSLDQAIKILKQKKPNCFFSELKSMVEKSILREFTL